MLPFSSLDNINLIDEELDIETLVNKQYNIKKPSELEDNNFECFKRKGLHFIHLNARSLFPKLSEVKVIAKKSKAAVICVTESWLDESHPDASVYIEGYSLLRNDRQSYGGGVCAYIREDLSYKRRIDLNNSDQEDIWFELLLPKSKPLYIGVIYRTDGNKNCFNSLEANLSNLRSDCDLLVLGDFNLCLMKNKSNLHKQYEEVLNVFNCKQLIKEVTRETDSSYSCLDHIFTNNAEKCCQAGVIKSGLSDHYITFCTRKIIRGQIGKHNTVKLRSLKNYSTEEFLNKLREADWSIVTGCNNVNDAWGNFKNIFIHILDLVAPVKEIRIKLRTEPWIDYRILQLIKERE